jgi:hypothetical protein
MRTENENLLIVMNGMVTWWHPQNFAVLEKKKEDNKSDHTVRYSEAERKKYLVNDRTLKNYSK